MNRRIFVERNIGFQIEETELIHEFDQLFLISLPSMRYFIVYDIFNITIELFKKAIREVFTEVNKDHYYEELPRANHRIAYEFLPGQYDQRADAAEQCIRLIDPSSFTVVKSGIVITFDEDLPHLVLQKIKHHLINTVESREKDLNILELHSWVEPNHIKEIEGFIDYSKNDLIEYFNKANLSMSMEDLMYIQEYYCQEHRNPFETEIRVLDTYWSDHCRHTTFETTLDTIDFDTSNSLTAAIEKSFYDYLDSKRLIHQQIKPITLMDLATINAKIERFTGNLQDQEVSDEINAASIYIDVDTDGVIEKWLLMFKNETHNHPTEIEPFGGASTCIGGAIRDPLSGRSYVYSAMRITGAGDITERIEDTIIGKLPQRMISKKAAQGYSSYGNQIGLSTTFVEEIHHPGYKAKRMEIGAVIGAVKAEYVRRETPIPGDAILLIGGATGRDGIGGATGSSKEHTKDSLDISGAEVQKGNAIEERKLQRLFRNPNVTRLIKKSNDFGAGGVSVAIGELADGISIELDKIPTKYQGINGTDLAISESQERMAVVVEYGDVHKFEKYCETENIEVTHVATVTEEKRLIMKWKDKEICNISRDFISTSGVSQTVRVQVPMYVYKDILQKSYPGLSLREHIEHMIQDPNISSKQGLDEMFDSSIGRTTVLSPYGGNYCLTKTQVSCHLIPTRKPMTKTVSLMAYGFNPYISDISPYHGSTYAIIDSMAKIVASGGNYNKIRFTFQEYFQKLHQDPLLWSKPFTSLLGAYATLKEFNLAAIGGKDSMSGSYHDLHVPPTLVSFAVTTSNIDVIISPEFKQIGSFLYLYTYQVNDLQLPNFTEIKTNFNHIYNHIQEKNIISAYALGFGGLAEALLKCTFGNKIGIKVDTDESLFDYKYGSILVESTVQINDSNSIYLGKTIPTSIAINGTELNIDDCISLNQKRYFDIYPITHIDQRILEVSQYQSKTKTIISPKFEHNVNVLIPVFPGTNCEYDSEDVFKQEGATTKILVFNNQDKAHIESSLKALVEEINNAHIIILSGGFSSGDEPDGSGKFIANVLKNKQVKEAIEQFLEKKYLIVGICNGFQALVKSGLLPIGRVQPLHEDSATLFKNKINRHIAKFVQTKVSSIQSPWLTSFDLDEVHTIPVSHGEGQFIISESEYKRLVEHNQIAFQYVDDQHRPTYNPLYNPNGSSYAIEGIISEDGLILGKMGHSERYQKGLYKNVTGNKQQNIFRNAIQYFKKGVQN